MDKKTLFDIVTSSVREVVPELEAHAFVSEDDLVGLGANSLDRAEIVNLTLEKLALNIPRVELIDAKTIGGLVDVLHARL
ncbi:acyl carrier protein [Myxococcus sp. 1LA]